MIEIPEERRKRFGSDTINDLVFWGIHFCVVAISLAIVWSRLDSQAKVLERLLRAQSEENALVQKQLDIAEKQAQSAYAAELNRNEQFTAASDALNGVVKQTSQIGDDVKDTLAKARETSELVFKLVAQGAEKAQQAEQAAKDASVAATGAANAASGAAGAAYRAAAVSSHTSNVVATKVVTSAAKQQLVAQQRALAAKQQQLSRTIKQVKKNGPNIFQRIFNQ